MNGRWLRSLFQTDGFPELSFFSSLEISLCVTAPAKKPSIGKHLIFVGAAVKVFGLPPNKIEA